MSHVTSRGEHLVATISDGQEGVIKVRDVIRKNTPQERWSGHVFNETAKFTPWKLNPMVEDDSVHIETNQISN